VWAVAAEALRRVGQTADARELLASALPDFPGVTRMLGITIPVTIECDGKASSRRLAEALPRSPRFRSDPDGLRASVWEEGSQLRFVMDLPGGRRHFEPDGVALEENPDATVKLVRAFLDAAP
jgi:hypothetical protein